MAAAMATSARSPAVRARMDPAGAIMVGNAPDAFAAWLQSQRQAVQQIIREANITLG
jgi:tripartite-type tricarboxylate transporter receptor subunit TctC